MSIKITVRYDNLRYNSTAKLLGDVVGHMYVVEAIPYDAMMT